MQNILESLAADIGEPETRTFWRYEAETDIRLMKSQGLQAGRSARHAEKLASLNAAYAIARTAANALTFNAGDVVAALGNRADKRDSAALVKLLKRAAKAGAIAMPQAWRIAVTNPHVLAGVIRRAIALPSAAKAA